MTNMELTPAQQDVVGKIEKLLRLAAKNPNEHEAKAAADKANAMLLEHNLTMAAVEANSGDKGKREDTKLAGGLYHFQRDLWRAVADLNFCLYWNMYTWDKNKSRVKKRRVDERWDEGSCTYRPVFERQRVQGGYTFEHRIVGRQVNVAATKVTAEYLQQAIERLTRERLNNDPSQFFTRWATSYREGLAERVIDKIYERRKQVLAAERRKEREAQKAVAAGGMDGASASTTLTLSSYSKSERDANIDFIYGEGTSAEWAAERAANAARAAKEEAEYTAWAKANPEEAKALEEKERKRRRSYGPRDYKDRKADSRDWGAFHAGHDKGAEVSIDPQAGHAGAAGRIGRR